MSTGKQKADFPGAYIPFEKSVGLVPTVPIDSAPAVQLCINEDWLPFVVTCLKALARPETWDDSYDNAVVAASEFAALISNIQSGCGVVVPPILCISGSFKDMDYGFVPTPGGACAPVWVAGVGWQMCCDSTPQGHLQIKREFGSPTLIREVHLTMTMVEPYLINYDIVLFDDGDFVSIASDTAFSGTPIHIDVTGLSQFASALFVEVIEVFGGCAADVIVEDFGLCYTGAFPLSISPGWTHTFDFTLSDNGFSVLLGGTYVSSTGWQPTIHVGTGGENFTLINIHLACTATIISSGSLVSDIAKGTFAASFEYGLSLDLYNGSVNRVLNLANPAMLDGSPTNFTFNQRVDGVTDVSLDICVGTRFTGGLNGSATLLKLVLSGPGVDPF